MWRKTGLACCILGLAVVAGTARGDLVIDTYTGWNSGAAPQFFPFGYNLSDDVDESPSGIETVGQTFTVGSELTVLENFKFWVSGPQISPIVFNAYVYEWATAFDKPTGSALYTTTAMTADSGSFQEFSFSPNLQLNANGVYVAFLSATSGVYGYVGARTDDLYSEGTSYYLNNAVPWGGSSWSTPGAGITDLVFQASFSSQDVPTIPEPSSWAILGLGCVCMALVRSRRSRPLPHA